MIQVFIEHTLDLDAYNFLEIKPNAGSCYPWTYWTTIIEDNRYIGVPNDFHCFKP